jgi:hypothetical protein
MKTSAEVVGILAIVGSLVFVGLELRQSQQIAIAAQYQERTAAGREYFYESLDSEYRIKLIAESLEKIEWPDGLLTEEDLKWLDAHPSTEWAKAVIWANIDLYGFDNYHYQYQSGFLSEEGWRSLESRLRGLLDFNLFAKYEIVVAGDDYRASFVEHARKLLSEKDAE